LGLIGSSHRPRHPAGKLAAEIAGHDASKDVVNGCGESASATACMNDVAGAGEECPIW